MKKTIILTIIIICLISLHINKNEKTFPVLPLTTFNYLNKSSNVFKGIFSMHKTIQCNNFENSRDQLFLRNTTEEIISKKAEEILKENNNIPEKNIFGICISDGKIEVAI